MPELISREPWWANRPAPGTPDSQIHWGWLEHYTDGSFRFFDERPSDIEIQTRKSCKFVSDLQPATHA